MLVNLNLDKQGGTILPHTSMPPHEPQSGSIQLFHGPRYHFFFLKSLNELQGMANSLSYKLKYRGRVRAFTRIVIGDAKARKSDLDASHRIIPLCIFSAVGSCCFNVYGRIPAITYVLCYHYSCVTCCCKKYILSY
jgi:hypothetical protein